MHGSVMVVEDDSSIREAMQQSLDLLGYEVITAANGQEALDLLGQMQTFPCLIYLDLTMPIMDGWEFRHRQQKDPKIANIPVVVLSADGNAKGKAEKIDAQYGIRKPLEFETLMQITQKYCR